MRTKPFSINKTDTKPYQTANGAAKTSQNQKIPKPPNRAETTLSLASPIPLANPPRHSFYNGKAGLRSPLRMFAILDKLFPTFSLFSGF